MYERLGFLFYALCATDRKITPADLLRIKEVVSQYWVSSNGSAVIATTDAANEILVVIEFLVQKGESPEDSFAYFVEFYEDHPDLFTCELKHRISDTAGSVIHVLENINPREENCVSQLNRLFTDDNLVSLVYG